MTTQQLTRLMLDGIVMDNWVDKKQVRKDVKTALSFYQKNLISKDEFNTIVTLAMEWEISTGLERKLNRKEDKFLIFD